MKKLLLALLILIISQTTIQATSYNFQESYIACNLKDGILSQKCLDSECKYFLSQGQYNLTTIEVAGLKKAYPTYRLFYITEFNPKYTSISEPSADTIKWSYAFINSTLNPNEFLNAVSTLCKENVQELLPVFKNRVESFDPKGSPSARIGFEPYSQERESYLNENKRENSCQYEKLDKNGNWLITERGVQPYCHVGTYGFGYITSRVNLGELIVYLVQKPSLSTFLLFLENIILYLIIIIGLAYLYTKKELKQFLKPKKLHALIVIILLVGLVLAFISGFLSSQKIQIGYQITSILLLPFMLLYLLIENSQAVFHPIFTLVLIYLSICAIDYVYKKIKKQ